MTNNIGRTQATELHKYREGSCVSDASFSKYTLVANSQQV